MDSKSYVRADDSFTSKDLKPRTLQRRKDLSTSRLAVLFLIPGILSLTVAFLITSQVLAFIGLGLTFWGALFFLITPVRYVQSTLLNATVIHFYLTVDRIVKDLKLSEKGYHIPPYPQDVYLPEHLKGLKEMIVFLADERAKKDDFIPSLEEMAQSKFMLENLKGICITPPGLGILTHFEREIRAKIAGIQLAEVCASLPQLILENLQLAKEIDLTLKDAQVHLKIRDSVYTDLYTSEASSRSIHFLGSPLVSAIACTIAIATGKVVTIEKDRIDPDRKAIEVWYRLLGD